MKIRMQQHNPTIGDLEGNYTLIKEAIVAAEADDIDLLLLPELATCGYPPMDLLQYTSFSERLYEMNEQIAGLTSNTAVVLGTITQNPSSTGRSSYNSALVLQDGGIKAAIHKTLLPTYDVFDELRYFEPNNEFQCVTIGGYEFGITICEDIWFNYSDPQYLIYGVNPAEELVDAGAKMILNLSASPYTRNKPEGREKMLQRHAGELKVPILYANQVGGNTGLISDGDSLALNSEGAIVARASLFKEDAIEVQWQPEENNLVNLGKEKAEIPSVPEQQFQGLVLGLQDYLRKTGVADKVVVGLSGGIDSSLVACIAKEALGAEKVLGITMPSQFSSEGSVSDSETLARNLGIELEQFAIKNIYDTFDETLVSLFAGTDFGVAEENLQPRIRSIILMACSNKFGHMLLNTGNKSELATGYCTLYGDMAGGLGIIADLYKTEVYELAHWLNNYYYRKEVIPKSVLSKPPSAELRPDQKDSDSLPEYDILDAILKAYLEKQRSAENIISEGFEKDIVIRILSLVDAMEYKRVQAPPALKLSSKAFGPGRRWPIVQQWTNNRL